MGRPTKIEGNPDHPASLGATDAFAQAAILDFYDPDRSQVVTKDGRVETWVHFQEMFLGLRERKREAKGAGLRILTAHVTSPTLADQLRRLREQFPQTKLHAYEPVTREAVRAGTKLAFGEELEPVYHLDKADVIVALDADFFSRGPGGSRMRGRSPRRARSSRRCSRSSTARRSRGARPRARRHESAVRDRVHADDHRRLGRPPAGRRGPRRRPDRPRHRPGRGRRADRGPKLPDHLARHAELGRGASPAT